MRSIREMHRSNNAQKDLDFFHFWKPIVRTFQFFCILHYDIFRPELNIQRLRLNLHRLFFILIVSIQIMSCGYNLFLLRMKIQTETMEKYNVSPIFTYVNVGTKFILILSFMMIPFENYFKRHSQRKLIEMLQCIDGIFEMKLKHVIDYRAQRRRQLLKTCLYFLVVTFTVFVSFLVSFPIDWCNSFLDFWFLLTRCSCCA